MGKFSPNRPLKTPGTRGRGATVSSTPTDEGTAGAAFDFEASFFSICCLLQTESAASLQLVTDYDIISKIVNKLAMGVPRDVEELALGAILGSLSWLPFDAMNSAIVCGLMECCLQFTVRFLEGKELRIPDRSCALALDVLQTLLSLDERAGQFILVRHEYWVKLAVECPSTYPSVIVKRGVCRLINTLIIENDGPFALDEIFWTQESSDLEVCCFMLISAFSMNPSNTSVILRLSNDPIYHLNALILEASTFTNDPSDEEELRLITWRSKLRGIEAVLVHLSESVPLPDPTEGHSDSIENRTMVKMNAITPPFPEQAIIRGITSNLLAVVVNSLPTLCDKIVHSGEECDDEYDVRNTSPLLLLEDRDLNNVFDSVSRVVKIVGLMAFRQINVKDETEQMNTVNLAVGLLKLANSSRMLVGECIGVLSLCLLTINIENVKGKTLWIHELNILKNKMVQLYQDEEFQACELASSILVRLLESVQMIWQIGDLETKSECADILVCALSSLTEKNIEVDSACTLIEAIFVVFSDSDYNLGSISWVSIVGSISMYLKANMCKASRGKDYAKATIENIKAFVEYKRNGGV